MLGYLGEKAGVLAKINLLGPTKGMFCPVLISMMLSTSIGSTNFFSIMAPIMCEIKAALG